METDTALITGAFTLGGVLVGGVLNNWLTHVLERRRQGWAGTTKARVFAPRMIRLAFAIGEASEHELTWDELCVVVEGNLDGFWTDFADTFAGTFSFEEWQTVYKAVRPLEQMTHTSPRDGTRITQEDEEYLQELIQQVVEAGTVLVAIGIAGPNRRRRVRRVLWSIWHRLRPLDEEKLLRETGWEPDEPAPDEPER